VQISVARHPGAEVVSKAAGGQAVGGYRMGKQSVAVVAAVAEEPSYPLFTHHIHAVDISLAKGREAVQKGVEQIQRAAKGWGGHREVAVGESGVQEDITGSTRTSVRLPTILHGHHPITCPPTPYIRNPSTSSLITPPPTIGRKPRPCLYSPSSLPMNGRLTALP